MPEIIWKSAHDLCVERQQAWVSQAVHSGARNEPRCPPPAIGPLETLITVQEKPKRLKVQVRAEAPLPQNHLEKDFVQACNSLRDYMNSLAIMHRREAFDVNKLWFQLSKLKP